MSLIVKGYKLEWENKKHRTVETDVPLTASRTAGVWLVDGGTYDNNPFRTVVGAFTQEDAARACARQRKEHGGVPPAIFRVFPLASLEPIALTGIVDEDWSAFQTAWIEVRL